jgi:VWFA-related protein
VRQRLVAVLVFFLLPFSFRAEAAESWTEAKARAAKERKPLVVYFRPARCGPCDTFERRSLTHPVIARRLAEVVFYTRQSKTRAIAVFDHAGTLRAQWDEFPPPTTTLAQILDSAIAAGPYLERAVALTAAGSAEADLELTFALAKLGRGKEAREATERAASSSDARIRQLAIVARAMLDTGAGKAAEALPALQRLVTEAGSPGIAATAWMAIGLLQRQAGNLEESIRAYETAASLDGIDPAARAAAKEKAAEVRAAAEHAIGPIRLVPPGDGIVTGRKTIRTVVQAADIAKVVFSVDGVDRATATSPPFSAILNFGDVPQPRTVRAVGFDASGKELGRAQLVVNDAGETFWLRILEPRGGPVSGPVRVTAAMRAPAANRVQRVVLSWNGEERAVIATAPWTAEITVPGNEAGVLRALAELDDGRTAEDAVLLNAGGFSERSDVPLVELPVTIAGDPPKPEEVVVREGTKRRAVESIASGAETPLTVGLLIDTSSSMLNTLPDVEEAAIRFLDTTLGIEDRAFVISFDSGARLVQPPTGDRTLLRREILGLRPNGKTALFDAMILGLLQFEGVKGRRALVVFSDGVDTFSRYHNGDVEELARRSNIPLFVIAAANQPTPQWTVSMNRLTAVSESTGGLTHKLQSLDELKDVYARIEADLRAQTLVTIRTDPGRSENDWRRIEVAVPGRSRVRAPVGYYAPW